MKYYIIFFILQKIVFWAGNKCNRNTLKEGIVVDCGKRTMWSGEGAPASTDSLHLIKHFYKVLYLRHPIIIPPYPMHHGLKRGIMHTIHGQYAPYFFSH